MRESAIADACARQLLALRDAVSATLEQIDAALLLVNGLAETAHARERAAAGVRDDGDVGDTSGGIVPDVDPMRGHPVFGRAPVAPDSAPPAPPAVT